MTRPKAEAYKNLDRTADSFYDRRILLQLSAAPKFMSSAVPAQFDNLDALARRLRVPSPKKQLPILQTLIDMGEPGAQVIVEYLREQATQTPTYVEGWAFCLLRQFESDSIAQALADSWPQGLVPTPSESGIDYSDLQERLSGQDFQAADRLTLEKLCELAGPTTLKRKWIYFTEVDGFPQTDLQTLDRLWRIYSQGKFGFSVQRNLWLGVGQNWERLWEKIAWKQGNLWTRYPGGFIWDLSAPTGHLPLSNQLRGVRVMAALMNHPAWANHP